MSSSTLAEPLLRQVGRSVPMRKAEEVVRGELEYLTDKHLPDMLHGSTVRSSLPHGKLRRVDTAAALKVPGVVAVLTARDVPNNVMGMIVPDWPVLAFERVRQVGDPVALVAATTPAAAEAGARAVEVDVEPLPVVDSAVRALQPDAPALHPGGNLLAELSHEKGDVETALRSAYLVVDRSVDLPCQEHVCLEPGGGVAAYEVGRYTIWYGSQTPGAQALEVARALAVDPSRIRMISTPMGGAFGSKGDGAVPIHLALLARATGRPVRIALTREEVMAVGAKRHPATVRTRLGVDREGRILALDTDELLDTGPYASFGPAVLKVGAEMSSGPYRVPNARFRGRLAYTNNGNGGAFRGYGVPQVAFALESALDVAAEKLDIDPLELRRRNVLRSGDEHGLYGHVIAGSLRAEDTIGAIAAHPWWQEREAWRASSHRPWRRGTGVAMAMKGVGLGSGRGDRAGARIAVDLRGRIRIWAGPNHSGQFIETPYAQIAADALGVPYEEIEVTVGDTDLVPESGSCAASRSTYAGGSAVKMACEELRKRLRSLGLDEPVDWAEAGCRLAAAGTDVIEAVFVLPDVQRLGAFAGSIEKLSPHLVYGSAAQVVRVEVNELTGELRVPAVACALDCGVAVNPAGVVGQTEGGIVQGLGYALMEEFILDHGVPATRSLETYLIPTAVDAPAMDTMLIESPEPTGPFGAKGIAEVVLVPTAPAVAAAVHDAVGVRVDRLPASPERVFGLLHGVGSFSMPYPHTEPPPRAGGAR